MQNYSDNWPQLRSLLTGFARNPSRPERYGLADHLHAKALSLFLANAVLATPRLDRATVAAVLSGRTSWPCPQETLRFEGVSLPLSFLETHGLVAFEAHWCTVHCYSVSDPEQADPSLRPVIDAVEHLKNICYGRNGYIRPHYAMPAPRLEQLLSSHVGSMPVAELLPELRLEDDTYALPPGNQYFSPLVSTCLWDALREKLAPKEAFAAWILCLRVNCDWAMPVQFDDAEYSERREFRDQLVAYLAGDTALERPMMTLWRQARNSDGFASLVTPDGSPPTLEQLSGAYRLPTIEPATDIELVQQAETFTRWSHEASFYSALIAEEIKTSIHVGGHVVTSHGFAETLFELADARPILKHRLFSLLPQFDDAAYRIWLLSRPSTCDIALLHLTQYSPSNTHRADKSLLLHIEKAFLELVCLEYLRAIESEADAGGRLLNVALILGDRCDLRARDFSTSFAYQALQCLLDSLNPQRVMQLAQALTPSATATALRGDSQRPQDYWYLLAFRLIERLEDTGIDGTGEISAALKAAILGHYTLAFEADLAGHTRRLAPAAFFAALPWHKLAEHGGVEALLAISGRCSNWALRLSNTNPAQYAAADAVRHYFLVLLSWGRWAKVADDRERIADRVVEIVRTLGFTRPEEGIHLFSRGYPADRFDLWAPFCSYANLLPDRLYRDLVQRCVPLVPLDQLFALLEGCTVRSRLQLLQKALATRPADEAEHLGLSGIEQAFVSACDAGDFALAGSLVTSAKNRLSQARFADSKHPEILRRRGMWMSYEYKWQLLELLKSLEGAHPDEFAAAAAKVPQPFGPNSDPATQSGDASRQRECDRFRRYILAFAYRNAIPRKCVNIMAALYRETKDKDHSFLLFVGRLAFHQTGEAGTGMREALTQFRNSLGQTRPDDMRITWVATILDAYRRLHADQEIDSFWSTLTQDQQDRLQVLAPYCKSLIERGQALMAQQLVNRYRKLNQLEEAVGELAGLIDDLCKAIPPEQSMSGLIQALNEGSQQTIVQLAKHYAQITATDFEDYVSIVMPDIEPYEFLRNAVLEVARELLLRKKNLLLQEQDGAGKIRARITKEDLINDWFTSLFDHRMAEARIGFRDQKRAGQASSGKNPGEIDGFITDARNRRLAIFEAFRLFSLDTNVISDHLNKLAGYDNESLSPVFIVAYCDVVHFPALVDGYAAFIARTNYNGFTMVGQSKSHIEVLENAAHLWLGMERRIRNQEGIILYHLLLNMGSHG